MSRPTERVAMDRFALLSLCCVGAAAAAMVGVSAGAVPQPTPTSPVWYAIGALVLGYWLAFVTWARGGEAVARRTGATSESREE
jgi:hypothetical protein